MGTDIHAYAERKSSNGSWEAIKDYQPFHYRDADLFAFFAGIKCERLDSWFIRPSAVVSPRGLPPDVSTYVKDQYDSFGVDAHTPSWLSVSELNAFDYDTTIEDRDVELLEPAPPRASRPPEFVETHKECLGKRYFEELHKLNQYKAERIVFWFDS